WVRLHGRMRTEGVTPGAHGDCNLYLKYAGGLVPTRPLAGTNPWTDVGRRIELPPETTRVTVGLFLDAPGTAWFDDVRLEVTPPPAWTERADGHYLYRTLPGDEVPAEARAFDEESYRRVADYLGVPGPAVVTYWKYPDLAAKEELSGRAGNAHREGQAIHSIFATDRHEIVHVLADAWGDPPALLGEGLAVYLSGGWQGRPVKAYAAELMGKGAWVAPSSIL